MSFKLLAIRPMPGTDSKFLKNLKPGVIYKFYQEYGFYADDEKKIRIDDLPFEEQQNHVVKTVERTSNEVPENLYSQEGGPSINISAVVGKNGSGKSSLVDFFDMIQYKLAFKNKELTNPYLELYLENLSNFKNIQLLFAELKNVNSKLDQSFLDEKIAEIEKLKKIDPNIGFKENSFLNSLEEINTWLDNQKEQNAFDFSTSYKIELFALKLKMSTKNTTPILESKKKINALIEKLKQIQTFQKLLIESFNFQIFIQDNNSNIEIVSDLESHLNEDYYTILLNFSLHSLNSSKVGDFWLNHLFHKNDGYTTPIVLNPYRDQGNINVNQEFKLNNERIFYNLCSHLNENPEIDFIIAKKYKIGKVFLNVSKNFPVLDKNPSSFIGIQSWVDFIKKISKSNEIEEIDTTNATDENHVKRTLLSYAIYKYERIRDKYVSRYYHDKLKFKDFKISNLDELCLEFLEKDNSHISFKLKRIFYCLKHWEQIQSSYNWFIWRPKFEVNIDEIKKCIMQFKDLEPNENILNLFLPPFYDYDFQLIDSRTEKYILLSDLSSGEQQSIFNISTIHYHTVNLNSIQGTKISGRKKYNSVNIVLDEIELYYHVDLQRELMNDLRNHLTEHFKDLSFNILCLTHSPFILSDIPSQNILRLKDGKPVKAKNDTNSFAANIHDLLADEFFLEDGFMGEFAKGKIQNLFNSNRKISENDMKVVELIGDQFVKSVLKDKLLSKVKNQELLDREIEKREKELSELKAKRDASN